LRDGKTLIGFNGDMLFMYDLKNGKLVKKFNMTFEKDRNGEVY